MQLINTNFYLWKCCFVMPGLLKLEGNTLNTFKSAKTFPSSYIFFFFFFLTQLHFSERALRSSRPCLMSLFCSPLDLEQCSLKVLEPEGSPSWSLLKLLGDRGCTVVELVEFLQAMEHTEALQCLSYSGQLWFVFPLQPCFSALEILKHSLLQ